MRSLLDRIDQSYPVASIRATGGAFASALWHDLMAAALDRPMTVIGDQDGTALGAAALGLLALDAVSSLEQALAALGGVPTATPAIPTAEQIAAFADIKHNLVRLLDALTRTTNAAASPDVAVQP